MRVVCVACVACVACVVHICLNVKKQTNKQATAYFDVAVLCNNQMTVTCLDVHQTSQLRHSPLASKNRDSKEGYSTKITTFYS